MANLRLVPPSGDPIEVTKEHFLVGRDPTCDLVLGDGSVSRKHARIERRGSGWAVVDQASANGTFLDSQRIADSVLHNGQDLRFGAVAYKIELPGAAAGDDDMSATIASVGPVTTPHPAVAAPPPPAPTPPPPAPPPPQKTAPAPPAAPPRAVAPPPPPPPPPPPRPSARPGSPGSPVGSAGSPPPAGKKGKGPVFWIVTGCCGCLALVALVAGGIFGSLFFMSKGAVDATRVMFEDLKKNDLDKAYSRLSSSYQARMSREEFEAFVNNHPGIKDNKDSTFASRSVKNDVATLENGVLIPNNGLPEVVTFELVKEGGDWKISDMRPRDGSLSSLIPGALPGTTTAPPLPAAARLGSGLVFARS